MHSVPNVTQWESAVETLKMRAFLTDMIRPTARPIVAPIVIDGRKIPAGTWIPNVHAVRRSLIPAVSKSSTTLRSVEFGLSSESDIVNCQKDGERTKDTHSHNP